ncbi:MAG: DnaJ C-terminal domain-containing protein [Pseudomonadota bacterium]
MANPYSVLGVPKSADEKAIKSAFRKLAKQYHPDQNPGDASKKAKFAEVNQAYEIVGDKEKRARFDRGEIDEKGQPKAHGFAGEDPFAGFRQQRNPRGGSPFGSGQFEGAEDILGEIFGSAFGGNARRGGAGFGGSPFEGMSGGRAQSKPVSLDLELKAGVTIEDLMRGKTNVMMPDGKHVSISIPPEASDRQVIRLKGKGKSAPGHPPGDALVTLVFKSDPTYQKQGNDLRRECPVPLETAVMGGKVTVQTLDGKLSLNIPAGTSSGKVFRLKGKGLPAKGGGFGDLLVIASLQLPEDRLDDLKELFKNRRKR